MCKGYSVQYSWIILFVVVIFFGGEAPSDICFRIDDEEEREGITGEVIPSTRSAGSALFCGVEGMSMLVEGVSSGGGRFDSRFVFCSENNEIENDGLQILQSVDVSKNVDRSYPKFHYDGVEIHFPVRSFPTKKS